MSDTKAVTGQKEEAKFYRVVTSGTLHTSAGKYEPGEVLPQLSASEIRLLGKKVEEV